MGLSWSDLDPSNVVKTVQNTINANKNISVGGTTIDRFVGNVGRNINNAAIDVYKGAETNYQYGKRGEIGQYLDTFGQSNKDVFQGAYDAIFKGQWDEGAKKTFGSLQNVVTGGSEGYWGQSSGVQNILRNQQLNDATGNTFRNLAGHYRADYDASRGNPISSGDQVDSTQLAVKGGALVAAFFGGEALAGGGAAGEGGAGVADASTAGTELGGDTVSLAGEDTVSLAGTDTVGGSEAFDAGAANEADLIPAESSPTSGGFWSRLGTGAENVAGGVISSQVNRLISGSSSTSPAQARAPGGGTSINVGGTQHPATGSGISDLLGSLFGGSQNPSNSKSFISSEAAVLVGALAIGFLIFKRAKVI